MNATVVPQDSDHWLTATDRIGGFAYGLGVSIGILLLITTIFIASYYCTRSHVSASPTSSIRARRRQRQTNETSPSGQFHNNQNDTVLIVEELGLNEEVIKSFPKLPYEEARVSYNSKRESSTTSCCSVCLADYDKTDMIRILPDCHHLFHDKCIDSWLRLNSTCAFCRTSPLPSPAMTPVADVVPSPRRIMDI